MYQPLLEFYEDLYGPLYQWNLGLWSGDRGTASLLTAAGLAGALMSNMVLVILLVVFFRGPVQFGMWNPVADVGIFWPFVMNYFLFIRKSRYQRILTRYEKKSEVQQRRLVRIAWGYVFGSFGLPIVAAWGWLILRD